MSRILTVRLEVLDADAARVIWTSHGENQTLAGCKVTGIGDGDLFKTVGQHEAYLEYLGDVDNRQTFEEWCEEDEKQMELGDEE